MVPAPYRYFSALSCPHLWSTRSEEPRRLLVCRRSARLILYTVECEGKLIRLREVRFHYGKGYDAHQNSQGDDTNYPLFGRHFHRVMVVRRRGHLFMRMPRYRANIAGSSLSQRSDRGWRRRNVWRQRRHSRSVVKRKRRNRNVLYEKLSGLPAIPKRRTFIATKRQGDRMLNQHTETRSVC